MGRKRVWEPSQIDPICWGNQASRAKLPALTGFCGVGRFDLNNGAPSDGGDGSSSFHGYSAGFVKVVRCNSSQSGGGVLSTAGDSTFWQNQFGLLWSSSTGDILNYCILFVLPCVFQLGRGIVHQVKKAYIFRQNSVLGEVRSESSSEEPHQNKALPLA